MKYCITMERTQRVAVWFDARNDGKAEEKAMEIYGAVKPEDFDGGDEEYNFAVENVSEGTTLIDWD